MEGSPPQREAADCNHSEKRNPSGRDTRGAPPRGSTRSGPGRGSVGNESKSEGRRLRTGEVGLDSVRHVGVPDVAVALAELHLVEVRLRRRHRRLRLRVGRRSGEAIGTAGSAPLGLGTWGRRAWRTRWGWSKMGLCASAFGFGNWLGRVGLWSTPRSRRFAAMAEVFF